MDDLDRLQQANWSPIVDVYIQISITKILDIDTINQRFQAEAFIESKWVDPNIKSLTETFDDRKIWKPDLYVENGVKDVREEVNYRIVPDNTKQLLKKYFQNEYDDLDDEDKLNDGIDRRHYMICEMRKVSGIFYENLELQDFPLDVQDLTIIVATKKPGNIVNFKILQNSEKKGIIVNNTLDKSMWKMHDILLTKEDKIKREFSYGPREYPSIKVAVKVFRLPGFFIWNALLPILLVTLASLAPFVVDIKIPQSRLPSTCTLMLTSVGIRWTLGRLLPTVSYLTSLDKYSLGTMLIITMELIYHAIMGAAFPNIKPIEFAYRIDTGVFFFFCGLILTKQILFIAWVIKVSMYRKKVRKGVIVGLNDEILSLASSSSSEDSNSLASNETGESDGFKQHKKRKSGKKFSLLNILTKKTNTNGDDDNNKNDMKINSDDIEAQKENMLDHEKKLEYSVRV